MARKKTAYSTEGEIQCKLIMVPANHSVGDFLGLVKTSI
jgi:hypothetical protein